jgi:glucose/arabinose transport system permease protein
LKLNVIVASIVLAIIGIVWVIPVYALVIDSLKSLREVMSTSVLSPPRGIDLSNIAVVARELSRPLLNTTLIVIPTAFIAAFIGTLAAYAICRRGGRISDTLMLIIAIATYIPYQVILVPLVQLTKALHIYNTIPGVIFGFLVYYTPMAALLMYIFLTALPRDVVEAALVDGADEWTIFSKVVLPLLGPAITSTIIFILIMTWNNFFIPLILTRGYEKHITLKIFSYVGQSGTFYNKMFAAALIGSLPPLVIFVFLGRYFIRGLLVLGTGAKG